MAPRRPKRKASAALRPLKTPPDMKKFRQEQKDDVNRRIALDLVRALQGGRQRAEPGFLPKLLAKYKKVYGEELVSQTAVYNFRKDILQGRASSWLPLEANLPADISFPKSPQSGDSAVSSLTAATQDRGKDPPKSTGGRPKGTTKAAKEDYERRVEEALEVASQRYRDARDQVTVTCAHASLRPRFLPDLIEEVASKYDVSADELKSNTIRSRYKRRNVTGKGRGHVSPMADVEPLIVEFCVQLARMGAPLDRGQVEILAYELVLGTETERKIREYKARHKLGGNTLIGRRWYSQFMKRHSAVIKRATTRIADGKRLQYITRENFQIMYDCVYKQMVEAGVAKEITEEQFFAQDGLITTIEEKATGLPSKYVLISEDDVIVVDETGCNTNQQTDGNIGRESVVVPVDGSCNGLVGSTADQHYTTFVYQTASGKPICCCIIMKSNGTPDEIPASWKLGIDHVTANQERYESYVNADDTEALRAAGNICRGGPVCNFRGKQIPPFITCSPNASITSQILAESLAYLDSFCLFNRSGGRMPFLLLDGHHSRFEIPFLRYIHSPGHKWKVCIGVPYATHWWQVADASQVNGNYKQETTKAKRAVFAAKRGKGLSKTDIIPIVNRAWPRSFGSVPDAKKAIAARGWNPLNYALLKNEHLTKIFEAKEYQLKSPPRSSTSSASANGEAGTSTENSSNSGTVSFNLTGSSTTTYLEEIVREQMKSEGKRKQIRQKIQQEKQSAEALSRLGKLTGQRRQRLSSTRLMREGDLHLSEDLLEEVIKNVEEKEEQAKKKQQEKEDRAAKKQEQLQEALGKYDRQETLRKDDLAALLLHVLRPSDNQKLPKTLKELKPLWDERKGRLPEMHPV